ncbi:hypothetical protein SEA_MAHAVRAT_51 [Mycobacterium phage Mahavrat]|uniref:Uncharacterized protein n=1 Tax=Mycobacterium phage Mahavrat TaxID=2591129 RepID=A0A515ML86_9CAUD|nr:hypothetical protein I5H59_gp51 [Mycobacterium phage Mahavrat]QDM57435.1 hypothetical protein SEA_MAHAVRAT_51 [Mycobacterium phage Mahavrat]
MNLVERLNARFNNVIHDGLAAFGGWVDPWLARLERQAMSNALGRDFGPFNYERALQYSAEVLAEAEAEEEVHEPARFLYFCDRCFAQMDQGYHDSNGGICMDCSMAEAAAEEVHKPSVGHRVSADQSSATAGDIGPGAGMVPPPPAPGPSNPLNTYVAGPLGEAIPGDEFMELGEFLDTATAEELAAMRRQREVSESDLASDIAGACYTWSHTPIRVKESSYIAKYLMENYHITPR